MTLSDEYLTTELMHTHMHNNEMCEHHQTLPRLEFITDQQYENGSSSFSPLLIMDTSKHPFSETSKPGSYCVYMHTL